MNNLSELINLHNKSKHKITNTSTGELDVMEEHKDRTSDVPGVTKKIQKFKRADYADGELIHIGLPERLKPSDKCRKRFAVNVRFIDKKTGKKRSKLVRFGKEGKDEFIDHKDAIKRERCIAKLGNDENWLHGNFYKLYLMNSNSENIYDAHKALVNHLGLI